MLNSALDIATHSAALAEQGRVQIPQFLDADFAEELHLALAEQTPWDVAIRDADGARRIGADQWQAMSNSEREQVVDGVHRHASCAFAFIYRTYMMVPNYLEQRAPQHLLHRMVEWLNTPEYHQKMRELTGDSRIIKIDCQATNYLPGDFLLPHNDHLDAEGRLYAYVINLARDWKAEWGGLLHFHDEQDNLTGSFVPRFNHLSLFRVPVGHQVSLVAPWAGQPRLAITGWLRMA